MNKIKKTSAKQKRDRTKIKITKTCPLNWVVNNKLIWYILIWCILCQLTVNVIQWWNNKNKFLNFVFSSELIIREVFVKLIWVIKTNGYDWNVKLSNSGMRWGFFIGSELSQNAMRFQVRKCKYRKTKWYFLELNFCLMQYKQKWMKFRIILPLWVQHCYDIDTATATAVAVAVFAITMTATTIIIIIFIDEISEISPGL